MIRERRVRITPGRLRWRQPEQTVEVTVGELGPSPQWATADDQDDAQPRLSANSTDATGRDVRRSMPASRSVVSVLLRALGDFSLHPQGRPCGRPPAAAVLGRQTIGLLNQTSRPPVEASRNLGTRMVGSPAWASSHVSGSSIRPGQPSSLSVPCSCFLIWPVSCFWT